ncbi:MAG: PASTA domain-containing protein, partial [Clostridia bacterium]|nr:PASTA domain-containing protein [Clostridia bacterium]
FALFKLQIIEYNEYQRYVIDQITVETNVNPLRGNILDINGKILATNKTVWVLYLCPKNINNPEFIAKNLYDITGIDYDIILSKALKKVYKYQFINNSINKEISDKIRVFIDENELEEQIKLSASAKRYYPYSNLASHTIGFVNADGEGIYGIEKVYNNILEGTNGRYITAQDAKSNDMPFQYEKYIEDENGYNLCTTIDYYIQYQLEVQLANAAIESGSQNRATGIVMNPKTGEIYAMATYPSFDLNDPYTLDDLSNEKLKNLKVGTKEYRQEYLNLLFTMWGNKAVSELYEPGSTFKLFTTSVALETGAANLHSQFNCTGSLKIDGYYRAISCHKRKGHGSINFSEALQQSCNPAMMTLAMRIGRENFYNYFKSFGYTGKTGIDLPSEATGYYHSFDNFSNVSLAVYSFGQTFKTTAIQQLRAISAVANGGYLVTPHLIHSIVDNDGNTIYEYETEKSEQIIDDEICSKISQILKEGVDGEGGAKNAYVAGYSIAAKTGTSEKKDKYDSTVNTSYRVSSCIAYAPSEDAQVAVIILVDEPTVGSKYGSVVAAPYVSRLLELILPYMGVKAENNGTDNKQIQVNNYTDLSVDEAIKRLKNDGISYEIIGNGDKILNQLPMSGSFIYEKTGKIILYTVDADESIKVSVVPDLIGKSPQEANILLSYNNLNIKIEGSINFKVGDSVKVISQYPQAGVQLKSGDVVTIRLMHTDEKE